MSTTQLQRYRAFAIEHGYTPIFPIQLEHLIIYLEELKLSNSNSSLRTISNCLRHYPDHDENWFKNVFQHPKILEILGIQNSSRMRFKMDNKVRAPRITRLTLHRKLPKGYNIWLDKITEAQKKKFTTYNKKKASLEPEPSLYISIPSEI
ncbi:hypothetical protein BJ944DRAFT_266511 [Cunninghamella echinulata]|nr:hypothetical protein BJ944DRAFT_266511 [Cunninghamella echinulata]